MPGWELSFPFLQLLLFCSTCEFQFKKNIAIPPFNAFVLDYIVVVLENVPKTDRFGFFKCRVREWQAAKAEKKLKRVETIDVGSVGFMHAGVGIGTV